ncbi:protein LIKE COV 1 isoform X1 [Ziziphus jujuba]|uniref:Protein LIKE COV 1 isoform X1 n=1 Tax=Ziziphus jujuba TaxID=326968 RepID=A0A6P4AMU7_ZIZJJ|nr:protein LIKE COV 1 isoform X1 [Ziziphus jujuba]
MQLCTEKMGGRRERDLERLIPNAGIENPFEINGSPNSSPISISAPPVSSSSFSSSSPSHHHLGKETASKVIRSWAWRKFMTGCVILLPIAITCYVTWWFIHLVDGLFSPVFVHLGIDIFGLGFMASITFIFLIGVFMSSWLGASVLSLGEVFIEKMPFISYIYSASKQISAAISPDQNNNAFKEVAILRHPRIGEYALGFITSSVILEMASGAEELCCVYVPTNHIYAGDVFLISSKDIMKPNLSVPEGIEIFMSGGISIPRMLTTSDASRAIPVAGLGKVVVPPFQI